MASELPTLSEDQLEEVTGAGWCRNTVAAAGIAVGLLTGGCAIGPMVASPPTAPITHTINGR